MKLNQEDLSIIEQQWNEQLLNENLFTVINSTIMLRGRIG